jgi:hypothetical protein
MTWRSDLAPAHQIFAAQLANIEMTKILIDQKRQIATVSRHGFFCGQMPLSTVSRRLNRYYARMRIRPLRSTSNKDRVWWGLPALRAFTLDALRHDFTAPRVPRLYMLLQCTRFSQKNIKKTPGDGPWGFLISAGESALELSTSRRSEHPN